MALRRDSSALCAGDCCRADSSRLKAPFGALPTLPLPPAPLSPPAVLGREPPTLPESPFAFGATLMLPSGAPCDLRLGLAVGLGLGYGGLEV